MGMKKIAFSLIIILLTTSCSFNKLFLHPTTVSKNPPKYAWELEGESVTVSIDENTYQPTFLTTSNDTLELDYTIESVIFENEDGNKLNGWMLKPKQTIPTVTILHFHGNSAFIGGLFKGMVPLVKKGYQVFMFDYSGYGHSEGKATRKNVLKDGNAALTYVQTRKDVKGTKLVIYGQSLGGNLSAVVAAERQDEIIALIVEGAFSSHKDIGADRAGFLGRILISEKYSSAKSISNFKKPVLVIHSQQDPIVPYRLGVKIFENANEPKTFFETDSCHICGPMKYTDVISTKLEEMLAK